MHVFDIPVKVPSYGARVRQGPVDFDLSTLADTVAARAEFVPQRGTKFFHSSVLRIGKVGPDDGAAPVNPAVQTRIVAGDLLAFLTRSGN
jgi:hypothetical protein